MGEHRDMPQIRERINLSLGGVVRVAGACEHGHTFLSIEGGVTAFMGQHDLTVVGLTPEEMDKLIHTLQVLRQEQVIASEPVKCNAALPCIEPRVRCTLAQGHAGNHSCPGSGGRRGFTWSQEGKEV